MNRSDAVPSGPAFSVSPSSRYCDKLPPARLSFRADRRLQFWLPALYGLSAVAAVWASFYALWMLFALPLLWVALAGALREIRNQVGLVVVVNGNGEIAATGSPQLSLSAHGSFFSRWLVTLSLSNGRTWGRERMLLVTPQSVGAEPFRRLNVILRHYQAPTGYDKGSQ